MTMPRSGPFNPLANPSATANAQASLREKEAAAMNRAANDQARRNATQAIIKNTPAANQGPGYSPSSSAYDRAQYAARATGAPLVPAPMFNFSAPSRNGSAPQPGAQATPPPPPDQRTALGGSFRGSTPAEINDFYANKPGSDQSAASKATAAAAGKGVQVQTPYGTVSGTDATHGTAQTNATGKPSATWQEQIVNMHPAIGQKGTQANEDFVKAYKAAQANGGTPNHFAIADQVMSNIKNQAGPTPATPGAPQQTPGVAADLPENVQSRIAGNTPDIKAPTSISPAPTTTFAGQNVPANQTSGVRSPEQQDRDVASQSAQAAGAGVRNIGNQIGQGFGDITSKAWGTVTAPFVSGYNFGKNFIQGLSGGDSSAPQTTAPPDSTSSPTPTPTVDRYRDTQTGASSNLSPQPFTLGGNMPSGQTSPAPMYIPKDTNGQ